MKNRLKGRAYIYIAFPFGFSGVYSNISARKLKIILGKSPPTPISSRQGIARDSGMKNVIDWRATKDDRHFYNI